MNDTFRLWLPALGLPVFPRCYCSAKSPSQDAVPGFEPIRPLPCPILYKLKCYHRLNIELDLLSLFGLLCTAVLVGLDPATPPLPPHLGLYTRGAIGQPR
jgi:hypothetical protein